MVDKLEARRRKKQGLPPCDPKFPLKYEDSKSKHPSNYKEDEDTDGT